MTDEPINHTEVTRTRTRAVNTGRTAHGEWWDYAPVTHPAIGQNTFLCKRCGDLVLEIALHDVFHEKLDTVLTWHEATQTATLVEPEKVTEPVLPPARTPRTRVKEGE